MTSTPPCLPQKPKRFTPGQRVRVCFRVWNATIVRHAGAYRSLNGDNEWVVKLDGVEGHNLAGDSEIIATDPPPQVP